MKKLSVMLVASLMVMFAFGTANALIFLDGKTFNATYEQPLGTVTPSYGTLTGNYGPAIVGGGVEFPGSVGGFWSADISNTNILFTFTVSGWFTPLSGGTTDGINFAITNQNGTPGIGGATLASTTLTGFDQSRLIWDTDHLYFNFNGFGSQGSPIPVGTNVSVNLTPTPIPGALLLFGSGLLGLVGIGRKRLRK